MNKGYDKSRVGIEALLHRGKYESVFPPHLPEALLSDIGDVRTDGAPPTEGGAASATGAAAAAGADAEVPFGPTKPELISEWATYSKLWTAQPLDKIRAYFGTKIGFYYLWLEYYTTCLIFPSIFGLMSLVYGVSTFLIDPATGEERVDVKEFCENDRVMCGLCSKCETWKLSDFCSAYETGEYTRGPSRVHPLRHTFATPSVPRVTCLPSSLPSCICLSAHA
jgi:hypothetical protein